MFKVDNYRLTESNIVSLMLNMDIFYDLQIKDNTLLSKCTVAYLVLILHSFYKKHPKNLKVMLALNKIKIWNRLHRAKLYNSMEFESIYINVVRDKCDIWWLIVNSVKNKSCFYWFQPSFSLLFYLFFIFLHIGLSMQCMPIYTGKRHCKSIR